MDVLKDLNPAQHQAVTFGEGPLLIVAGAGTGKTAVITRRIAWLIAQGRAKPEEILALTFTDKAAGEMEERVDRLLPLGYVNVWISTFHSFGERILRDYALDVGLPNDFKLLTTSELWMLMRNNLERFALDYYRPVGNPTRFIHALIQHFSRAKDEMITPAMYLKYVEDLALNKDSELPESIGEIANAYHVYQQLLLEHDAFDFGDLINYTLELFKKRPRILEKFRKQFKYILVDEFQDTNIAQYELVKMLAAPRNNLTVVGDDDQSVYKFRGASLSNILEFKKDFPASHEVVLTENYRSYQTILDVAYGFIQRNNPYRLEVALGNGAKPLSKKLTAARSGAGEVVQLIFPTAEDEAEGVAKRILQLRNHKTSRHSDPPAGGEESRDPSPAVQDDTPVSWSDFAILVRANASAPLFLEALRRHGIPFNFVANRGLYREQIIVDIVSYLKLLNNYHESEALYRVLTVEPFLLPHEDIVLLSHHATKKTTPLYSAFKEVSTLGISEAGREVVARLSAQLERHATLTKIKSAAEIYVQAVEDLGMAERVSHPALARDASFLASFYKQIQRFESESEDRSLNAFLKHLSLALESGEEGQLPEDMEEGPDTVKVITVHAAKGLEWRYVFLVQLIDRRFPSSARRDPIELPGALIKETLPEGDVHLQEERRLFYVAMTRARDGLYLTRAHDYFGKTTRKPSVFLSEVGEIGVVGDKAPKVREALTRPAALSVSPTRYTIPETFSFSSVSAFRKCPLEYKFHYLLKLPRPGSGQLSFGNTIHKTLELFLKMWQERQRSVQADLFGKSSKVVIPTFEELVAIYEKSWEDDWYESAAQKKEYRTVRGPLQLKHFYDHFVANKPTPNSLEEKFKIAMGPYKFVGKIDRIDKVSPPPKSSPIKGEEQKRNSPPLMGGDKGEGGVVIIDYKTGDTARKDLEKVDRDQLIIYQLAAEEFLHKKVVGASYWYLAANEFTESFVATLGQTEKLKTEYAALMDKIVETVTNDSFIEADADAAKHDCRYEGYK